MKLVYECEGCGRASEIKSWIFNCRDCNQECCEDCMGGYARCKDCYLKYDEKELEIIFDKEQKE